MGQSIDVKVYNTEDLIEKIDKWAGEDIDLLMSILRESGTFVANESQYAFASNDCAHKRDKFDALCELLESAFHKDDIYNAFYKCSTFDIMSGTEEEIRDIAERLLIELKGNDD